MQHTDKQPIQREATSVETLRRHDHINFIEEHFKSTNLAIMYRHGPNPHDEIFQGAFT